jgi:hypothetical protein
MNSTRSVETWRDLGIGTVGFLAVAGAFDFMNSKAVAGRRMQVLDSFTFAVELLVAAAVGAGLVWLVLRAIRGADGAPDLKDALLWNACLIGAVVTALRMVG